MVLKSLAANLINASIKNCFFVAELETKLRIQDEGQPTQVRRVQ